MAVTNTQEKKIWAPWDEAGTKPFVRIEGVTKKFGNFVAVDNISLDIYEREFFSLLGPSGCGKTTLLRMLAGFETPTSGKIIIDGEDMSSVAPYNRPVNMMFQSYALFPHMTVEKNIAFGLVQDGIAKDEIHERVGKMISLVQMEKFAGRKPEQLSGGQRQRVALARALVKNPKILLLDEPLGALDKKLREETQFELMCIQEDLGITFVIVTHDQEEAMTVSSRIALIDQGNIVQVATPHDIYESPNSRNVAEFIGDVNILHGFVEGVTDEQMEIRSPDTSQLIKTMNNTGCSKGDEVWIAIRPEKMMINLTSPDGNNGNCLEGTVWDIGYLGKLSIYHVKLDSGVTIKVAQTNRLRETDQTITWEDKVYLSWSPDASIVLMS